MKENNFLNYGISIAMMGIILVGTFFLPQFHNYNSDSQIINVVHTMPREEFKLGTGIAMPLADRLDAVLDAIKELEQEGRQMIPVLNLNPQDIQDPELISRIKEEVGRAVACGLFPDILSYNLDESVQKAEFYNLGSSTAAGGDVSLWAVYFGDYENYEFIFWVDASSYLIYYAELCSPESEAYWSKFEEASLKEERTEKNAMVQAVMDACAAYYEPEEARGTGIEDMYQLIYGERGIFYYMGEDQSGKRQMSYANSLIGFEVLRKHIKGESAQETFEPELEWLIEEEQAK